jgi:predicted nucleic acid-binding protein
MKYLLDVNALIAAIWRNHPDHSKADTWLQGKDLATCPLSDLGFRRMSTNPKALNADMATSRRLLQAFQKHSSQFIPDDLPALKCSAQKSEQVTDCYPAELAASNGMKLATLDAGIVHAAVQVIY